MGSDRRSDRYRRDAAADETADARAMCAATDRLRTRVRIT
jgi:hypothetical protein